MSATSSRLQVRIRRDLLESLDRSEKRALGNIRDRMYLLLQQKFSGPAWNDLRRGKEVTGFEALACPLQFGIPVRPALPYVAEAARLPRPAGKPSMAHLLATQILEDLLLRYRKGCLRVSGRETDRVELLEQVISSAPPDSVPGEAKFLAGLLRVLQKAGEDAKGFYPEHCLKKDELGLASLELFFRLDGKQLAIEPTGIDPIANFFAMLCEKSLRVVLLDRALRRSIEGDDAFSSAVLRSIAPHLGYGVERDGVRDVLAKHLKESPSPAGFVRAARILIESEPHFAPPVAKAVAKRKQEREIASLLSELQDREERVTKLIDTVIRIRGTEGLKRDDLVSNLRMSRGFRVAENFWGGGRLSGSHIGTWILEIRSPELIQQLILDGEAADPGFGLRMMRAMALDYSRAAWNGNGSKPKAPAVAASVETVLRTVSEHGLATEEQFVDVASDLVFEWPFAHDEHHNDYLRARLLASVRPSIAAALAGFIETAMKDKPEKAVEFRTLADEVRMLSVMQAPKAEKPKMMGL